MFSDQTTYLQQLITMVRCLACLVLFTANLLQAANVYNPVSDLEYHQALYAFYLDEPLQGLTYLAIKQEKQPERVYEQSLLLETALQLDYGMTLQAIRQLQSLGNHDELKNTDQLWLYLSQVFYEQQDYITSSEALGNIRHLRQKSDRQHQYYLLSQLALKKGELETAHKQAEALNPDNIYYSYLYYNLAIYHYQQGRHKQAISLIESLLTEHHHYASEEHQQLYERLMITAAYMQLYQGKQARAIELFSQLSLESVFLDEALLGFGRTALATGNLSLAAVLWKKLQDYPLVTGRKIEASLSLATLHEKQKGYTTALAIYEKAETLCLQRLKKLESLQEDFSEERLWPLFSTNKQNRNGKPDLIDVLRQNPFLVDLLNQDDFSRQVEQLHDLDKMISQLQQWQADMPAYNELLDQKQAVYKRKRQLLDTEKPALTFQQLLKERQNLYTRYDNIRQNKDARSLSTPEEQAMLERIESNKTLLPLLTDDPWYDDYAMTLRLAEGVMIWRLWDEYQPRLRQAKRELDALDKVLDEYQQLHLAIAESTEKDIKLPRLTRQLQQNSEAISSILKDVEVTHDRARDLLARTFTKAVNNEKANTTDFQRHTRLAIARVSEYFLDPQLHGGSL